MDCEICGNTQEVRAVKARLIGTDMSLCRRCFDIWYDEGLIDTAEISQRSRKHNDDVRAILDGLGAWQHYLRLFAAAAPKRGED